MYSRENKRTAINHILKWLSDTNCLEVTCSMDHVLDRMEQRDITIDVVLRAIKYVVNGEHLCEDLFESALQGGSYNGRIHAPSSGLKVLYSVYTGNGGRRNKVVIRTVA